MQISDCILDVVSKYGNLCEMYDNGVITDMEKVLQLHSLIHATDAIKRDAADKESKAAIDSAVLLLSHALSKITDDIQRTLDIQRAEEAFSCNALPNITNLDPAAQKIILRACLTKENGGYDESVRYELTSYIRKKLPTAQQ